ncbi:MAG TPA: UDP-N-acetylmuramoyl-L-alanyl-D-glutamate--2,6-diaminopimelate ligase [Desulfurivibrionaceae bacterium]|nr:UDP-N-acetylmuramoyl-L-alanyl-D-glutamate--2,6-diaminopimelate ligase [Desulfurivibrionaceae bacterium]
MNDKARVPLLLGELMREVGLVCPPVWRQLPIAGVAADSRQVSPGWLFVAMPGESVDGHDFLDQAVARGAVAILVEDPRKVPAGLAKQVAVVKVADSRTTLAGLAAGFYGHPERELKIFGITGTNGKTTTSYLLEAIIRKAGGEPGVIGTVNYRYLGRECAGSFTTPEPLTLFALMREMVAGGVTHLIMEVSSHGLALARLAGLQFDLALFTNLSRDHLDFHGTMAAYFAAKKTLFTEHLKETGAALVMLAETEGGADDWGARLVEELMASGRFSLSWRVPKGKARPALVPLLTCGRQRGELRSGRAELSLAGTRAELLLPDGATLAITSPLVGDFNLENILVAVGGGWLAGIRTEQLAAGVAEMPRVPGRLERVEVPEGGGCLLFVDYAHTPDALARVLVTLRRLGGGRLVVVFGCGGDRDRGKRPLMGEVAGRLADVVLITSDNPRSEEPLTIMGEIERGLYGADGRPLLPRLRAESVLAGGGRGYDLVVSRRQAIRLAVRYGRPGDVVLLAGKGHEDYQLIKGHKYYFDDRLEAALQMQVVR